MTAIFGGQDRQIAVVPKLVWLLTVIANHSTVQLTVKAHPNSHRISTSSATKRQHCFKRKDEKHQFVKTTTTTINNVTTMLAKVTTTLTGLRARTCCSLALRRHSLRSLSTATATEPTTRTNEDLVKAAVHKMMLEQHQQQAQQASVTEEALHKASYCLRVSFVVVVAVVTAESMLFCCSVPHLACLRCLVCVCVCVV